MSTQSPNDQDGSYDHDGDRSNESSVNSTPNFMIKKDVDGLDLHNDDNHSQHTSPDKRKATRRSVACKSCHSLKVKCTPADSENPAGPCIRCLNSKRKCEIDLSQPRKRRKKSEKQRPNNSSNEHINLNDNTNINTHTNNNANYSNTTNTPISNNNFSSSHLNHSHNNSNHKLPEINSIPKENLTPEEVIKNLQNQVDVLKNQLYKQQISNYPGQLPPINPNDTPSKNGGSGMSPETGSPIFVSKSDLEKEIIMLCESSASTLSDLTNNLKTIADKRTELLTKNQKVDLVSKGLITIEEANERLELYNTKLYVSHPLVEVPANMTADQLRINHPFLFNAIMSVTSTIYNRLNNSEICLEMDNETIKGIAIEILVAGTKSVDLIKSLLLLCLWYNTPELFRHRRYHLLNQLSVTLLHDVGIIARPSYTFKNDNAMVSLDEKKHSNLEYDSLILILYFTTVSFCLILRRAIFVKWTPFVEECCVKLENSGIPKWKHLALFLRLSHELDRIHNIIHCPDANSRSSQGSKYIILELQNHLSQIKPHIDINDRAFAAYYYSVEAYLHEPVLKEMFMKNNANGTGSGSGSNETDGHVKLNADTVQSVAQCTSSCLNALDALNSMDLDEISILPLLYGARIIYTAGMLLRLRYLILSLPSHIEKDLVPRHAVVAIQRLNHLLDRASSIHPTNQLLKKLRLVIQLFIQTYATQVQDLLKKNGETPKNFAPTNIYRFPKREINEMEKLNAMYETSHAGGLITTESGRKYNQIPLNILSFAASCRRESNSVTSPESQKLNGVNNNNHNNNNNIASPSNPIDNKKLTNSLNSPITNINYNKNNDNDKTNLKNKNNVFDNGKSTNLNNNNNSNNLNTNTNNNNIMGQNKVNESFTPNDPNFNSSIPKPSINYPPQFRSFNNQPSPNIMNGNNNLPTNDLNQIPQTQNQSQNSPVSNINYTLPNINNSTDNPSNNGTNLNNILNNGSNTNIDASLNNKYNQFNSNNFAPPFNNQQPPPPPQQTQTQQQPPINSFNPSMPVANDNNTLNNRNNIAFPDINDVNNNSNQLAKHLANPDQLESSYLALNDEFWVNLLSTDSDKINFTNANNTNNFGNDEVFYMN